MTSTVQEIIDAQLQISCPGTTGSNDFAKKVAIAANGTKKLVYSDPINGQDFRLGGDSLYRNLNKLNSLTLTGEIQCGAFDDLTLKIPLIIIEGDITNAFNSVCIISDSLTINSPVITNSFLGTKFLVRNLAITSEIVASFVDNCFEVETVDMQLNIVTDSFILSEWSVTNMTITQNVDTITNSFNNSQYSGGNITIEYGDITNSFQHNVYKTSKLTLTVSDGNFSNSTIKTCEFYLTVNVNDTFTIQNLILDADKSLFTFTDGDALVNILNSTINSSECKWDFGVRPSEIRQTQIYSEKFQIVQNGISMGTGIYFEDFIGCISDFSMTRTGTRVNENTNPTAFMSSHIEFGIFNIAGYAFGQPSGGHFFSNSTLKGWNLNLNSVGVVSSLGEDGSSSIFSDCTVNIEKIIAKSLTAGLFNLSVVNMGILNVTEDSIVPQHVLNFVNESKVNFKKITLELGIFEGNGQTKTVFNNSIVHGNCMVIDTQANFDNTGYVIRVFNSSEGTIDDVKMNYGKTIQGVTIFAYANSKFNGDTLSLCRPEIEDADIAQISLLFYSTINYRCIEINLVKTNIMVFIVSSKITTNKLVAYIDSRDLISQPTVFSDSTVEASIIDIAINSPSDGTGTIFNGENLINSDSCISVNVSGWIRSLFEVNDTVSKINFNTFSARIDKISLNVFSAVSLCGKMLNLFMETFGEDQSSLIEGEVIVDCVNIELVNINNRSINEQGFIKTKSFNLKITGEPNPANSVKNIFSAGQFETDLFTLNSTLPISRFISDSIFYIKEAHLDYPLANSGIFIFDSKGEFGKICAKLSSLGDNVGDTLVSSSFLKGSSFNVEISDIERLFIGGSNYQQIHIDNINIIVNNIMNGTSIFENTNLTTKTFDLKTTGEISGQLFNNVNFCFDFFTIHCTNVIITHSTDTVLFDGKVYSINATTLSSISGNFNLDKLNIVADSFTGFSNFRGDIKNTTILTDQISTFTSTQWHGQTMVIKPKTVQTLVIDTFLNNSSFNLDLIEFTEFDPSSNNNLIVDTQITGKSLFIRFAANQTNFPNVFSEGSQFNLDKLTLIGEFNESFSSGQSGFDVKEIQFLGKSSNGDKSQFAVNTIFNFVLFNITDSATNVLTLFSNCNLTGEKLSVTGNFQYIHDTATSDTYTNVCVKCIILKSLIEESVAPDTENGSGIVTTSLVYEGIVGEMFNNLNISAKDFCAVFTRNVNNIFDNTNLKTYNLFLKSGIISDSFSGAIINSHNFFIDGNVESSNILGITLLKSSIFYVNGNFTAANANPTGAPASGATIISDYFIVKKKFSTINPITLKVCTFSVQEFSPENLVFLTGVKCLDLSFPLEEVSVSVGMATFNILNLNLLVQGLRNVKGAKIFSRPGYYEYIFMLDTDNELLCKPFDCYPELDMDFCKDYIK